MEKNARGCSGRRHAGVSTADYPPERPEPERSKGHDRDPKSIRRPEEHQKIMRTTLFRPEREPPPIYSMSTTMGAWSDGPFPLRASRSITASVTLAAMSALASTRSIRMPLFMWNMPAR